jgi:hypothetical protein
MIIGQVYGVYRYIQQYYCYILAVSFIGGGNRSTQRKPLSLQSASHNVESGTLRHERDSNSQI